MSRGEIMSLIVAASCAVIVATPVVLESASPRDAEAVIAAQFVAAITGTTAFIMFFFYRRRAHVRRALQSGRGLLARWTYDADEWRRFVTTDPTRRSRAWLRRIGLVLGWSAAAALVVIVHQLDATRWIALVLLAMFSLCALIGGIGGRSDRRREETETPTALIGRDGLVFRGDLHVWRGWGNRLERCAVEPDCFNLTYSTPNKGARPEITVHIPIPVGQQEAAIVLAKQLAGDGRGAPQVRV